jgi:hypothetical protein
MANCEYKGWQVPFGTQHEQPLIHDKLYFKRSSVYETELKFIRVAMAWTGLYVKRISVIGSMNSVKSCHLIGTNAYTTCPIIYSRYCTVP